MLRPLLLMPLALCALASMMLAGPATGGNCSYPPSVHSYSRACAGPCVDSGSQTGNPAVSSRSGGFTQPGYDFGADAALTIDTGYFSSSTHVGGSMTITQFTSNNASSNTTGDVFDCLTMGGSTGSAVLHIPIQLQGSSTVSWSIGGAYQPGPGFAPAGSALTILCAADAGLQYIACDDPSLTWSASDAIDTVVELVLPFTFEAPVTLQFGPRLSSGVGYAANGSDGTLEGIADLAVDGRLLPAYVKDLGGSLLPDATITAESSFDYLHPVPEPCESAAVALLALGALRRARQSFAATDANPSICCPGDTRLKRRQSKLGSGRSRRAAEGRSNQPLPLASVADPGA